MISNFGEGTIEQVCWFLEKEFFIETNDADWLDEKNLYSPKNSLTLFQLPDIGIRADKIKFIVFPELVSLFLMERDKICYKDSVIGLYAETGVLPTVYHSALIEKVRIWIYYVLNLTISGALT